MKGFTKFFNGYLSIQSPHTPASFKSRSTTHTLVLHLKPAPNVTMKTLSPLLSLLCPSIYDSTYQTLLAEVLPNLCRVILAGSMSYSVRPRPFPTPSITAAPPVWRQKCLIAVVKNLVDQVSTGNIFGDQNKFMTN